MATMSSTMSSSTSAEMIDEKHVAHSEQAKPSTANLSEQEKEIIDRQLTAPNLTVGYFSLFRYATSKDLCIMAVAAFASIGAGAVMPLMTVRFSEFISQRRSYLVFLDVEHLVWPYSKLNDPLEVYQS